MMVDSSHGIIKHSNGSFIPFMILPDEGRNRYFTRLQFANLVDYQFDHANKLLYYANRTHIFNATLNVTRDGNGLITNILFNSTAQFRGLDMVSFKVIGTYLVVAHPTVNSNRGRIQIYNYNQPLPPLVITNPRNPPPAPANNITLVQEFN